MAEELDVEIVEEKMVSNAEAYKLLKKVVDKIMEREGSVPILLSKTLEYLSKFSKIDPDSAQGLRKILEKYGLKQETIIMIMNICPKTIDELRTLLDFEEKVMETETIEEIIESIKPYCIEK